MYYSSKRNMATPFGAVPLFRSRNGINCVCGRFRLGATINGRFLERDHIGIKQNVRTVRIFIHPQRLSVVSIFSTLNFHFPSRPVLQDGQPTELRGGQLLLPPADGGIAQDLVHPRSGRTDRRGGGAEGNLATAVRRPAHDARDQARGQSSLRLGLRVSLLGLALHDTRAHGLARELGGRSGWAAGEQRGPQNHHGSTSTPRCFPSARCSVGSARTFCTGIYVQDGPDEKKKIAPASLSSSLTHASCLPFSLTRLPSAKPRLTLQHRCPRHRLHLGELLG